MENHGCKLCNKLYASYKSLWNHNKKFHILSNPPNIPIISSNIHSNIPIISSEGIHKCIKCKKSLSSYKNKWRHEQKCKYIEHNNIVDNLIKENNEIKERFNSITNENAEIKLLLQNIMKQFKIHPKTLQKINKQLINNSTINNGTINNTVNNIVKFGSEDFASIFSQSEILKILNHKMMSLEESIKAIHFNDNRPAFKNIYITNLKDQYAYIFDGNKFTAGLKSTILSELVDNHFEHIEYSAEEYKHKLQPRTIEILNKFIDMMNKEDQSFTDKEHKIKYPNFKQFKVNMIKVIIYNEKRVVNVLYDEINIPNSIEL